MKKFALFIVFCSCVLLAVAGIKKQQKTPEVTEKKQVLVTLPVYRYFVERIAGEHIDVHVLVPPGANPHAYEPSPLEVHRAQQCSLWVRTGEPMESKILTALSERNQQLNLLNLAHELEEDLIETHDHDHHHHCCHDEHDLHFWLSPKLAKKQAELINNALCKISPKNKSTFHENLKGFLVDLDQIDLTIQARLENMKHRAILVSHAALGYFCRDYHLKQLSLETEGKDPLPKELARTLMHTMQENVSCVLTQPQYNNKGAELIAEKLSLPVRSIDPYDANYLENLRLITEAIAE